MTRMMAFSSPLLLGFEEIERLLDRVSRTADGYPPYNIARIAPVAGEPARVRIILAVAGFHDGELDITIHENELSVSGCQKDGDERDYLHRGIAARQFRRTFVLADGMNVTSAVLANGLLTIELVRPETSRTVRQIPITTRA